MENRNIRLCYSEQRLNKNQFIFFFKDYSYFLGVNDLISLNIFVICRIINCSSILSMHFQIYNAF